MKVNLSFLSGMLVPKILTAFAAIFFVTFFAASTKEGLPAQLDFTSKTDEVVSYFGGDVQYYMEQARDWLENGKFGTWHVSIFPPGTAIVWSGIIKYSGEKNFLYGSMLVTVFLWAVALTLMFFALSSLRPWWLRFLATIGIWFFSSFRDWSLGVGLAFSESKATPLFIAALACAFLGLKNRALSGILGGVIFMTLATYARVYFDTLGIFIYGALFVCGMAALYFKVQKNESSKKLILSMLVALPLFFCLLFPWKWRNMRDPQVGKFAMAPAHQHMTFYNLWLTDEKLPEFIIGGNSACHAQPETCEKLDQADLKTLTDDVRRNLALGALVRNPLSWYWHRAKVFSKFWVDQSWNPSSWLMATEGIIVFSFVLYSLWIIFRGVRARKNELIDWAAYSIGAAFFLHSWIMFTFAGMDYRHSLPLRLFFYYFPFLILSLKLRKPSPIKVPA
ncbi:MAG: hypothetical protein SGJ18_12425 [Pseudomonadota bacterium]|nr:hypothetical protein [Pseudomonadota bacterium]